MRIYGCYNGKMGGQGVCGYVGVIMVKLGAWWHADMWDYNGKMWGRVVCGFVGSFEL